MNVSVLCFVLPPANGSIRLGKAEVRQDRLRVGGIGSTFTNISALRCIKKHPGADRRLKTVTAEHLQTFLDLLTFGGTYPDGKVKKGLSKDYIHSFSAVLQQSFRFAVFPKQLITSNTVHQAETKGRGSGFCQYR